MPPVEPQPPSSRRRSRWLPGLVLAVAGRMTADLRRAQAESRSGLWPYALAAALAWTALIAASVGWSLFEGWRGMLDNARHEAQISFQKEMLFRFWADGHGGSAPATNNAPPGPDLARAGERALVNPASMLRQMQGRNPEPAEYRSRLASLKPLRPENVPDAWEAGALQAFAQRETEVAAIATMDGQEYMRVMRPLVTEAGCMTCHGAQDYKVGDIHGGMSVSVPLAPLRAHAQRESAAQVIAGGVIWVLGLGVIGFGARRMQAHNLERARAETVRDSEVRYRTLADSGQALIWTSGPDRKCDYFNQPWLAFTGRTLEQERGDGWTGGVHPDDRARCLEIYTTAFDRREAFSRVHRLRRHDGEFRWIQDDGSPRHDSQGNFVGYIGHGLDITERKQLEARFLQAQRLENLGALASGIAHDLNNVLAPVLMATALLKDRVSTEADRRMVATMEISARRGADIIRQVLTFARGVQGERVPLQLRHLVREMADIAAETFPRNIQIEMDAAKDLWPVIGDATQLHQVLMNLCINARDAMPAGGQLTLAAENLRLDETFVLMSPGAKAGPYVCLKVSDTGTGIAPENCDKIFDPFFTTKEPGKGTGLGLATVLGIVKSHGGFAQFKSTVGRGTGFAIYLPAAPGAELPAGCEPTAEPPRGQGELILVVDDEDTICAVASRILEKHGYRVLSASEGSEALMIYLQNRAAIAAVVTDMLMPGLDGPTLVRLLRRTDPAVRLVGITGIGEATELAAIKALALPRLLFKPFTADKLLFALHEVLHPPPVSRRGGSASPLSGPSQPATPDSRPPMNPTGR